MKTAVEWLQEEVERILKSSLHREQAEQLWESFEKAKEIEKEQIKNERVEAYDNGYANGQKDAYTE